MGGKKVLKALNIVVCFVLAVLVVPAVATAAEEKLHRTNKKPYRVNDIGNSVALHANIGIGSFVAITASQVTDATGVTQTTLEFVFTSDSTQVIVPASTVGNNLFITTGTGDNLIIQLFFQLLDVPVTSCIGSVCSASFSSPPFVSFSFTLQKNGFSFFREGHEKGVLPDGISINDFFRETTQGADVSGTIFGVPFFGNGELSTFRGDPALAPLVLNP